MQKKEGGRCLSKSYINAKTKLEWECSEGHRWWATPSNIRHIGTWCPKCSAKGTAISIDQINEIATAFFNWKFS